MSQVYVRENEKHRLFIHLDEDAGNPREDFEEFTTMVYSHSRYILGDTKASNIELYGNWNDWLRGQVLNPNGGPENVVYLPLFLYDHGGLAMNTTGFPCTWDSGQVGWIYATKDAFRNKTGYREDELFSNNPKRVPEVDNIIRVNLDDRHFEGATYNNTTGWGKVTHVEQDYLNAPDWFKEYILHTDWFSVDFDFQKALNFKDPANEILVEPNSVIEVLSNYAEEMLRGQVELFNSWLTGDVYGYVLEEKTTFDCCGNKEYTEIASCWNLYEKYWAKEGIRMELPDDAKELIDDW